MDFYYHPILGLQFTCGLTLYEIDLDVLSNEGFAWENYLKLFMEKGVFLKSSAITRIITNITSNSIL